MVAQANGRLRGRIVEDAQLVTSTSSDGKETNMPYCVNGAIRR